MYPITMAYHDSVIGQLHREAARERLIRVAMRRRAGPAPHPRAPALAGRSVPVRQS
jgi:hypothetical protein